MNTLLSTASLVLLGAPLLVSVLGLMGLRNNPVLLRRLSLTGAATAFASALVLAYGVLQQGSFDQVYAIVGDPNLFHFSVGVWVDRLSILSVLLITSIGLVVQRYSVRYLDGDNRQGNFFTGLSFVLFAVTLFVISRNLLALTLSWFAVSAGVHRLLLHFSEREAAQKAAWRKFVVSRVGDTVLIAALLLTYSVFGTFELKEIFEIARTHGAWDPIQLFGLALNPCALVGSLYVIGAMTKSAQFPFHIWLPETMETPTPVSALMHAGIINAGGFLIVRLSPLVAHASFALHVLFLIGALTALFGGLIYLVQTDVKRSLAYSTISQMGYMMMQCGLGAFGAAVLHLVMHGYYKAHAFLSAAGRVDLSPLSFKAQGSEARAFLPAKLISAVLSLILLALSIVVLEVDIANKPGGVFLCLFLWFSSTQALSPLIKSSTPVIPLTLMTGISFVGMVIYWSLLGAINHFLDPVLGSEVGPSIPTELSPLLVGVVAIAFVALFGLVELARVSSHQAWAKKLYVLCLNHFYVEQTWRKVISKMLGKTRLMPSFETVAVQKDIATGSLNA